MDPYNSQQYLNTYTSRTSQIKWALTFPHIPSPKKKVFGTSFHVIGHQHSTPN